MFGRRKTTERRIEQWRQERLLFRFWDGRRVAAVDPFRVYRELVHDKSVDLESAGPQAEKWEEPATTQVIELICRVFRVERYDPETGEGLTDSELMNLFADLNEYLDAVKKKSNPGPTLPQSTA